MKTYFTLALFALVGYTNAAFSCKGGSAEADFCTSNGCTCDDFNQVVCPNEVADPCNFQCVCV
ncbi:hypothetical protein GQ53DRAFT_814792 [Thozetella sp. PMI_491]|nr:hypothetical protein GQ53DRAFT_814792 [Thozetella sp. PMI_491]